MWLLLEGTFTLDCQFGRHDCGDEQSIDDGGGGVCLTVLFFDDERSPAKFRIDKSWRVRARWRI